MTETPDMLSEFDAEAVRTKYKDERDKRMVAGRGAIKDLTRDEVFAEYLADPFASVVPRNPLFDDIDVAIVGGGLAGVVVGAQLRKIGLKQIRLIDRAGGLGGTWYWNRYPGVMCDVESYCYMPMLEEMGYVPKNRYAFGEEIREHIEAIAARFDLVDSALFHTGVEKSEWDESLARWVIRTDRGDEIRARYLVMATGILNLMKLPDLPGIETFKGKAFHTARWDYEYTGGGPDRPLVNLADKVVGIVGTGASAVQCVPPLAESCKHLYVIQRTPAAVGVRANRPTAEDFGQGLASGLAPRAKREFPGGDARSRGGDRSCRRQLVSPLRPDQQSAVPSGAVHGGVHARSRRSSTSRLWNCIVAGFVSTSRIKRKPTHSCRITGTAVGAHCSTTSTFRR